MQDRGGVRTPGRRVLLPQEVALCMAPDRNPAPDAPDAGGGVAGVRGGQQLRPAAPGGGGALRGLEAAADDVQAAKHRGWLDVPQELGMHHTAAGVLLAAGG
jgi:hypothetical protein